MNKWESSLFQHFGGFELSILNTTPGTVITFQGLIRFDAKKLLREVNNQFKENDAWGFILM